MGTAIKISLLYLRRYTMARFTANWYIVTPIALSFPFLISISLFFLLLYAYMHVDELYCSIYLWAFPIGIHLMLVRVLFF